MSRSVSIEKWFTPWIVAIVAFLVYLPTTSHDYVLDDIPVIKHDKHIQDGLSSLPEIWTSPYRSGIIQDDQNLFRPFTSTTFALDMTVADNNPSWGHFLNILLYAFCSFLVFKFSMRFFGNKKLAFIASLLFVLHPLHVEVVANIKSRDEILGLLFFLLALINTPFERKLTVKSSILPFFFGLLACYSKESVIAIFGIVPFWAYLVEKNSLKKALKISAIYLAAILLYFLHRYMVLDAFVGSAKTVTFLENVLVGTENPLSWVYTNLSFVGHYIQLLVYPDPLISERGYAYLQPISSINIYGIIGALSMLILPLSAIYFSVKRKNIAIPFVLISLFLLLFCNWIFLTEVTVADRMMFIPVLGLSVLYTEFYKWIDKRVKNKVFLKGAIIIVFIAFAALTIMRSQAWKDNFTLYTTDVRKAEESARLNFATGLEYGNRMLKLPNDKVKNFQQAQKHFEKAIEIYPEYDQAYTELGILYVQSNQLQKAQSNFAKAIEIKPENHKAYTNLAIIDFKNGDSKPAISKLDSALKYQPQFFKALQTRASIMLTQNQATEAYEFLKDHEQYYRDEYAYYELLREIANRAGKRNEALKAARRMRELN